jgi:hypothetical protein
MTNPLRISNPPPDAQRSRQRTTYLLLLHHPAGHDQLHRNQLYMWRRELRSGALGNTGTLGLDFVPVVAERRSASGTGAIEIEIGGAVLRAGTGVDLAFLGRIVRLLKAT